MNATRIYGDVLDLCRQRSKNLDALHGNELTHLVESDLGLAARDHFTYRFTRLHRGSFRFDLVGDAELLKHADEIDAARSGRVGDGFCCEH